MSECSGCALAKLIKLQLDEWGFKNRIIDDSADHPGNRLIVEFSDGRAFEIFIYEYTKIDISKWNALIPLVILDAHDPNCFFKMKNLLSNGIKNEFTVWGAGKPPIMALNRD